MKQNKTKKALICSFENNTGEFSFTLFHFHSGSSLLPRFNAYGYRPSMRSTCRWLDIGQVLFCVFMESRSINTQKNITRPISNHLDRTNLVKCGLYTSVYGIWDKTPNMINFPCRTEPVYRAGMIFPSQPATQSQHEIQFILPAHGASHIIKYNNDRQELAIIPYFHS